MTSHVLILTVLALISCGVVARVVAAVRLRRALMQLEPRSKVSGPPAYPGPEVVTPQPPPQHRAGASNPLQGRPQKR